MLHAACVLLAVCRMLWSRQVHRDDLPLQWRSCQVMPCYARAHGTHVCTHADWVCRRQHVRVACCSLPRFLRLYAACDVACRVPRVAGTSWMRTGNGRYRYARRRSFTLATDPPNARARTHTGTHSRTHARLLAGLHHAGAPVDLARRVPHAARRLHDVHRVMHAFRCSCPRAGPVPPHPAAFSLGNL